MPGPDEPVTAAPPASPPGGDVPATTERSGSTRRDPWLLGALALLLLVARIVAGTWESRHPAAMLDRVHWVEPASAETQSLSLRKPILYDFSADWCAPCQAMRNEMFTSDRYARAIEQVAVPVRIVDRRAEEGRNTALVDSLQRACRVTGFPTLAVVWNGRLVDTLDGYHGAMPTLQWLMQAAARARRA